MLTAAAVAAKCTRAAQTGPNQWQACCPAHDDSSPSLSIADGATGTVLHCHAGCDPQAVLDALALNFSDLYAAAPPPRPAATETVYVYTDADGQPLYEVVRIQTGAEKTFRQRSADGQWSVRGIPPVPYRLPALLAAQEVWVVEGEKDADRLAAAGLCATCNSGGAGRWRPEFADHFRGRTVYVVPDADEPGLAHAAAVADALREAAAAVTVLALPGADAGSDVSDWLDSHTVDDLLALRHQPPPQPAGAATFRPVQPDAANRPRREWLMGTSHIRGVISLLVARGGTGKSSLLISEALALATGRGETLVGEHVHRPCRVASIVCEDDHDEYHRRLEAAMIQHRIDASEIAGRLLIATDHRARFGAEGASPGLEAWLYHQCQAEQIDVLQIDPWVNALAGSENDNVEIARITESLTDLARAARICIRIAHHVRKSGSEATGDDARGASALLNAARVVQVLNPGYTDAVNNGADEAEARSVIRLDNDKANLSGRSQARYYRLTPVFLQNGPDGGDSAAVTLPYSMPDPASAVHQVEQAECVNAAAEGLPDSVRSAAWAGHVFGRILRIDSTSESGRARLKRLIAQWLDRGVLRAETRTTGAKTSTLLYPGRAP